MTTVAELQSEINSLMGQLSSLQSGNPMNINEQTKFEIDFYSKEIEKIEKYGAESTTKIGVLFSIAGLLSFLPPLAIESGEGYLSSFLIFTFPFLIISIFIYYFSALRIQPVIKEIQISSQEIENLFARLQYLKYIWPKYESAYRKFILGGGKFTTYLIYVYILSLSLNFYLFSFWGKPSVHTSLDLLVTSFVIPWLLIYFLSMKKSEKNKRIGYIQSDLAIGSAPADI